MTLALPSRRLPPQWVRNDLWRRARAVPSLDLRFAENKSLVDAVSGQNLITFTRASGGTYVDSQGVIRNAVTNLLLRSEEFGDASWIKTNASITENAALAPNGTTTADKLLANTTNGIHAVRKDETVLASTTYTLSFYAKAAEYTFLAINHGHTLVADYHTFFDLSSGTVGTSAVGNTASIQSVGNGWYRCSVTRTTGVSQTSLSARALACQSDNVISFVGDTSSGIYIWGAHLEQSSTVGEYIPTGATINSAPRFDHNPTTGESLGLLVEEQKTNLLLRSEEFETTWINSATTDAPNVAIAPNGAQTADEIAENSGTTLHYMAQQIAKASSAITYTASIFVKRTNSGTRNVCLAVTDGTTGGLGAIFDPDDGSIVSSSIAIGSITGWSISTLPGQSFGNGWWRLSIVVTTNTSTRADIVIYLANGSTLNYTGDGVSSLYLWGAQLEAGAFPTSYIPTTTSAATRAADVASISGSNFSSWYRQDEGTIHVTSINYGNNSDTTLFCIDDDTTGQANQIDTRLSSGVSYRCRVRINSTTVSDINPGPSFALGEMIRLAQVYKQDDFAASQNGLAAVVDTSGALPAIPGSILKLKRRGTNETGSVCYQRFTFWPQRLGNEVLQRITQ